MNPISALWLNTNEDVEYIVKWRSLALATDRLCLHLRSADCDRKMVQAMEGHSFQRVWMALTEMA